MRNKLGYLLILVLSLAFGQTLFGQLKVDPSNNFVKIGDINNPPQQLLHIEDAGGNTPGFLIEAINTSGNNFFKAVAGTNGSAFVFNKNTFMLFTPAANSSAVTADWPNSFVLYGQGSAYPGRVGIGVQYPLSKLHVNGDIQTPNCIIASNVNCPSDVRLKKEISEYRRGLKSLVKLQPIQYEYNGRGGTHVDQQNIGLIAQEVEKVAPELVQKGKATDKYDDPYLQIRESEIKYIIINAVKEQQELIEELQKQLNKVKNEIKEFKSLINEN